MFSSVNGGDPPTEEAVGHATARIDPPIVEEGQELRVLISVVAHEEELHNLKIRIDFGDAIRVDGDRSLMKYRQGPISHTSRGMVGSLDGPNRLMPEGQVNVEWTMLPVPDFRLTKTIRQMVRSWARVEWGV